MKYQAVKGMKDIVPGEIEAWQVLEERTRRFLEAYGFREIRTPILETTDLFSRSIGEASDIVHKEMYTFEDRGGRSLTMRPEMTASVVRACLEHNLIPTHSPLYIYYIAPMYRAERPQAGRKREFYQIGVETLNTHSAVNDAELLIMIKSYLESLGLSKFTIRLNNLGTSEDRLNYAKQLTTFFKSHEHKLCADCNYRLSKNVLRVFDCKVSECQPIIQKAPTIVLSKDAGEKFEKVKTLLKEAQVPFHLEPKLVRGLDYYTGCVYEVTTEGLGAQDALLAGGRYDGLIESLGGPRIGASGFALGVERLLMALQANQISLADEILRNTVYVAGLVTSETSCSFYRDIAKALFLIGKRGIFSVEEKSLSNHLKQANKLKAGYAVIVGDDEYRAGEVTLKEMTSGTQKRVKPSEFLKAFNSF
ncbi:MAG: histidine--tRNA ligase [Candidatus Omnitrophica bacterium]|nr:histidine--tRNA ligase [Candidatus Omnitrophota bacterium]